MRRPGACDCDLDKMLRKRWRWLEEKEDVGSRLGSRAYLKRGQERGGQGRRYLSCMGEVR